MNMSQNNERRNSGEEKISINDLGLEKRKPSTCDTPFGKIRHWRRLEQKEWLFLGISYLSAFLTIALTIERMVNIIQTNSPDFTFACLLLLNTAFCIFYIIHGIFREDPYEIAVFILTNLVVLIYVILNYVKTPGETLKTVRLGIIIPLSLVNILLGLRSCKQYWTSKHLIFGIVGANEELTKICMLFFLCGSLLIFDLQLQFNCFILVLIYGTDMDQIQEILLLVGVIFSIVWAINGYYALRKESQLLIYLFWGLSWGGSAYIIYKLVTTIMDPKRTILFPVILVAICLAIIVRIGLISATVAAYLHFGKGYKELRYAKIDRMRKDSTRPINS